MIGCDPSSLTRAQPLTLLSWGLLLGRLLVIRYRGGSLWFSVLMLYILNQKFPSAFPAFQSAALPLPSVLFHLLLPFFLKNKQPIGQFSSPVLRPI